MLKFRFRKKEMRRRSNSCPNLESSSASFESGVIKKQIENTAKHSSCYVEEHSSPDSEDDATSPSRKEQLHAQKSIRRVKRKEKEQQENVEKNLLSADDFWRKIDSLKEWLHEEQGREVEKMQSPKLRSHFKKFIRLWNKRKLPLKYYRNCCVDAEEGSSIAENPNPQSPGNSHGTLDLTPHTTLKDLPSYHRFPFIDEPLDSLGSVFTTPVSLNADSVLKDSGSPFSTFGKSPCEPHTSTSRLAKELKTSQIIHPTSPPKFASISRSMMVSSSVFKSHESFSPQLHPVVSPICPCPPHFVFPQTGKGLKTSPISLNNDDSIKNQSPAYMSVQDAIPFACNSPKYCQVEFDPIFEHESGYCSLSPFNSKKKHITISRKGSNLSRRRSKSMEDIYAVPSRLVNLEEENPRSFFQDEIVLKTPPIPAKRFAQTPSMVNLGVARNSPGLKLKSETHDTLRLEPVNGSESQLVSLSDFSSLNSTSTDFGYHSCKIDESSGLGTNTFTSSLQPPSSFQSRQEKPGMKRRSGEDGVGVASFESFKKSKSNYLYETDIDGPVTVKNDVMLDMEVGIADFLKDPIPSSTKLNEICSKKQIPKLSILTGSINPTVRSPKVFHDISQNKSKHNDGMKKDDSRLSILEIKVLDSSPKLPRRRMKRRSSSFSVTPGKNLTFGNKNSRLAMSSPRRVSFAKNVKNGESNSTPHRQKSSLLNTPGRRGDIKQDISRQSQDKANFESFWAHHQQPVNKSNSPTKETKPWSPTKETKPWSPKWLSPSKNNFANKNNASSLSVSQMNNSDFHSSCSKGSESVKDQHDKKGSFFITTPSPKKIFSSLQKNTSLSSLHSSECGSIGLSTSGEKLVKGAMKNIDGTTQPKSILKVKSPIKSHVTNCSETGFSIFSHQDLQNTQIQALSAKLDMPNLQGNQFSKSYEPNLHTNQLSNNPELNLCDNQFSNGTHDDQFSNTFSKSDFHEDQINKHYESNFNHCRSPPRLGVASFRSSHNPSSRNPPISSHCKVLFSDSKLSCNMTLSTDDLKRFDNYKSQTLPQANDMQYLVSTEITHKHPEGNGHRMLYDFSHVHKFNFCSNTSGNEKDEHHDSSKAEFHIQTNGTVANSCEGKEEEIIASCNLETPSIAEAIDPLHERSNLKSVHVDEWNCDDRIPIPNGSSDMQGQDDIRCDSEEQYTDKSVDSTYSIAKEIFSIHPECPYSNADVQYDVPKVKCSDSLSENERDTNIGQDTGNDDTDTQSASLKCHVNNTFNNETHAQESHSPRPAGDEEISKNVLERIKSFRASPKIEDNDGWITERRRSKGNKSKSFRSAHNRYLLQSVSLSQDDLKSEFVIGEEKCEVSVDMNCNPNVMSSGITQVIEEKSSIIVPDSHTKDDFPESSDVDNGYETESKSKEEKQNGKSENESESSLPGSVFATEISETLFPIYDVPKNGINKASPVAMKRSMSQILGNTCPAHVDVQCVSSVTSGQHVEKVTERDNLQENPKQSFGGEDSDGVNKENSHITKTQPKPLKPKPLVKPKPPSRTGSALTGTLSTKNVSSPQHTAKRRSSINRRESLSTTGRRQLVSPYKSNTDHNSTRVVARKRSSVTKTDDFRLESFKNNASANVTSASDAYKSNKDKRESLTPRKRRTSLEKGKKTSGPTAGPEQTSFAQRRKFFQQLQVSANSSSSGPTTSHLLTNSPHPLKATDSFLRKSKPQPRPKPIVKPKPRNDNT